MGRFLIHDLENTQEIAYDADTVALRYMRLNSLRVRQKITYHCLNQHAHRDSNGDEGLYVMVKTADGQMVDTRKDKQSIFLDVIKDECNLRIVNYEIIHTPNYRYQNQTHEIRRC